MTDMFRDIVTECRAKKDISAPKSKQREETDEPLGG